MRIVPVCSQFPVPGLTFQIPLIGGAGVYLIGALSGSISRLSIDLGIDACTQLPIIGEACGSALTSALPIEILDFQFNFK